MSKDWYLMTNSPQRKDSSFERDEFFDYAQDYLDETLDESFLGIDVVLYQNGSLDETAAIYTKAIVQGNTPVQESFFDKRTIITRIGSLKLGNYVKYDGDIYLITEPPGNNQFYEKGLMRLCNCDIGWINDKGEEVWRKSVFRDSTRYSSGESEGKLLMLGDMRIEIFMPKDNETIKISRGKRFIVDDYDHAQISTPMVYKVSKTNLVQRNKNGDAVFMYIMTEDSFDSAVDNRGKMIANYYKSINQYSLELITPENIQIEQGNTFQIQCVAKINNKIVASDIMYISDNESISSVNENGLIKGLDIGNNQVKVIFNEVSKFVNVCVTENRNNLQTSCRISYSGAPVLRVGSKASKTFTANFYDENGNSMNDIAVWTIEEENGSLNPSYIKIASQTDNKILLRCTNNSKLIGKIIYLKLTGASGYAVERLPIELTSLT